MKLSKLEKLLKDDNVEVIVIKKKQEESNRLPKGKTFTRPADNTLMGEKLKIWECTQKG